MNSRLLHLKSDKSDQDSFLKVVEKDTAIVGGDFFALREFSRVEKEDTSIISICEVSLTAESIIQNAEKGFLFYRNDEHPDAFEEEPYFYKDQTLKPFSGRANPHTMLKHEDFFLKKPVEINFRKLFTSLEELEESWSKNSIEAKVLQVDKKEDLWEIHCSNGTLIKSRNLYWGIGRKRFFNTATEGLKDRLSEKDLSSLLTFDNVSILNVYYLLPKAVVDKSQTVFIPQSFTHDWGHFIVDFSKPDNDGTQKVRAYALVYDDDILEEELGKKIKLLKRNLEKVYSDFFKDSPKEEVRFGVSALSTFNPKLFQEFDAKSFYLPCFFGLESEVQERMESINEYYPMLALSESLTEETKSF